MEPPDLIRAACVVLEQGEAFLRAMPKEEYVRRHPHAFNATIGGHYRHCLDHFLSLLRVGETMEVNYDKRDRDPQIEAEPALALKLTSELRAALPRFTSVDLDREVKVRCSVAYDGSDVPVHCSTFGRELVYAITHAVHHFALMAFLARQSGAEVPENFGLAPSTAKFLAEPLSA
jgi:hypothetical protein